MTVKYQIFVSSTYKDLKNERDQVIKAILEMGHIPVGMEMFSAADEEQWKIIQRHIDQSDYYIVLVAHRYGSMDGDVSYTEKEYDYAVSQGIPVLGFIIDDSAPWPVERVEDDEKKKTRLGNFKGKVKKKPVGIWTGAEDLYGKSAIALMKEINTNPRVGWTRASLVAGPEIMNELSRLSSENARLRQELENALQKVEDEEAAERIKDIRFMAINKIQVSIWKKHASDWSDPVESTLYDIFGLIASELVNEKSLDHLARYIGRMIGGFNEVRDIYPIPSNSLRVWLADLLALDLVRPSVKKRSVKDTSEYWILTAHGRQAWKYLRRAQIKAGDISSGMDKDNEGEEQPPPGGGGSGPPPNGD